MDDGGAAERAQLLAQIRGALVRSEGELGLDVTVDVGIVTLRGVVQTYERRARIEALSRRMSLGFSVKNEITVVPPELSAAPETLP